MIPERHCYFIWIPTITSTAHVCSTDDYIYAVSESKPIKRCSLAKNAENDCQAKLIWISLRDALCAVEKGVANLDKMKGIRNHLAG